MDSKTKTNKHNAALWIQKPIRTFAETILVRRNKHHVLVTSFQFRTHSFLQTVLQTSFQFPTHSSAHCSDCSVNQNFTHVKITFQHPFNKLLFAYELISIHPTNTTTCSLHLCKLLHHTASCSYRMLFPLCPH